MGKAKDQAGNIWEVDAQGNPISLVSPARGPNLTDPRLAPQTAKANNEANASNLDPARAEAALRIANLEAQIKAIQAASAGAMSGADLQKAQLEVVKLRAEIEATKTGKGSALRALQTQADRVGELYGQNIKGGAPNFLNSVIPDAMQPGKGQFDSAAQGLVNPFMAAFKVQGQGSQSDTELRQFIAANTPEQGDPDVVVEEKLRNIQTRIDAETGGQRQEAAPAAQADPLAIATGGSRTEIDPALKAAGAHIGQMLSGNVPDAKIIEYMRGAGIDPANTNIGKALSARKTDDFKRWQRANPGKVYPIGPEFYTRSIPMSGARNLFNKTAATDSGGALYAGLASSANAISGGRLDNAVGALSGDPNMARAGMELLRTNHPLASVVGDVAGQATVEATLGRIPGARGLMVNQWGRRGADALYGAYSGSGENDENPIMGALTGAATNMTGGMAGRSVQRGVGRVATGVRNADLRYLHNQDVPLSVGRIARGSDNIVGHAVGGIEERMAGMPISDAIIGAARRRGDEGFNRAAFREIGVDATGADGVNAGREVVGDAYSFLDNATMRADPRYRGTLASIRRDAPDAFRGGVLDRIDQIRGAETGNVLSGRDWQSGIRGVRADRASIAGQPFSDRPINSLNEVEESLIDLAGRQGPPDSAGQLANANRLNRHFRTLVSALDNGPAQKSDELFSVGRLDDAARANARKFGGQVSSIGGNRPFYDLTSAGKAVMPNLTPDSGTAGRAMLYSALLGGGGGAGLGFAGAEDGQGAGGGLEGAKWGLGLSAALAAPYSKVGQKALQRALLSERPEVVQRIGDFLIANPRLAGMFGGGMARDYVYQNEVPY